MKKNQPISKQTRERVLTFRVSFDQLDQLKRSAREQGQTVSGIIRQRLRLPSIAPPGPFKLK